MGEDEVIKNGGAFLLARFVGDGIGSDFVELEAVGESGAAFVVFGDCETRIGLKIGLPSFRKVRSCRNTPMYGKHGRALASSRARYFAQLFSISNTWK
jgi:hypothetical protein